MDTTKIANKYSIMEKIGQGKFGTVYKGTYDKTNEPVAIKIEDMRTSYNILKHETTILKYLRDHGCRCVPDIHWFGVDTNFQILVMTYYECSLQDYLDREIITQNIDSDNNILKKCNSIMVGCLRIIETIHSKYIIHRDIKPQNFMMRGRELYIIDFGLSTFYIKENREHIENVGSHEITGNPKYMSYYIHEGDLPSRRDDLISLGYIYLYMVSGGKLPWDQLVGDDIHFQRKEQKSLNVLDERLILFESLRKYLHYCYLMEFDQQPFYEGIHRLFS